jgi:hypothetical protein
LSDGVFTNGVTAAAVVQFVADYDGTARIEDVAAYFHIEVDDVGAALDDRARQIYRSGGSGPAQAS